MKSVLISIQPKWVEKIASGEKPIEVRKTRPKIETPFKCYIYCTYGKPSEIFYLGKRGKVIGEFVCDRIDTYLYDQEFDESMGVYLNNYGYDITSHELGQTCLSYEEFEKYGNTNMLYGWHISDLKIYDKPKKLSEFWTIKCTNKRNGCLGCEVKPNCIKTITRPFQSWGYVESLGE